MTAVATLWHLGAMAVALLAVMALWPVRRVSQAREEMEARATAQDARLAAQDREIAARGIEQAERLAAYDERVATILDSMHALNANVMQMRVELSRVHLIHPPEQHPHTLAALAKINERLDGIDGKLDEVVGRRMPRPRRDRGPN